MWRKPLEALDRKRSEALSKFLSSLCPALTGKEDQWGRKPANPRFLHQFSLFCPRSWQCLEAVISEVSLSVKQG